MQRYVVLLCEDFTAAGINMRCCKHCHGRDKGLSPKWPPEKRGGIDLNSKLIGALCCHENTTDLSRSDWARAFWSKRKKGRAFASPSDYIEAELLEAFS